MRTKIKAAVGIVFLLMLSGRVGAQENKRPNIVIILADDMGFSDLGCYGSEILTPNIDRLASEGVRFTTFYNCARCCPSRACLLTGKYPHQVGIGEMIDGYSAAARAAAESLGGGMHYQDHLSTEVPTVAELLHGAGYRTLMCGKWHLGARESEWPVKRGFDRSFVQVHGAMNYFGSESDGKPALMALDDKVYVPPKEGFYSTDAFTDHAIEVVEEAVKKQGAGAGGEPFFLYLAFNAPHWPLQAPEEDIAKYRGKYDRPWQQVREERNKRQIELGVVDPNWEMAPMDRGKGVKAWAALSAEEKKEWGLRMSVYAAQVSHEDACVGKLMEELKKLNVAENTLVMFLSDNGGAAEDPNRSKPGAEIGTRDSFRGYARPWATVSNTPLRLHKVTANEGGISTPFIARWPAGITKSSNGSMINNVAHLIDLMPTCMEVAGKEAKGEGKSLVGLLKGGTMPERTLFWEHEGNRAIRDGKWKLVWLEAPEAKWQLFDLEKDRTEQHDLAGEQSGRVRDMIEKYEAWAKRCGVIPRSEIDAKIAAKKAQG